MSRKPRKYKVTILSYLLKLQTEIWKWWNGTHLTATCDGSVSTVMYVVWKGLRFIKKNPQQVCLPVWFESYSLNKRYVKCKKGWRNYLWMDRTCSASLWRPVLAVVAVILGCQHPATECAVRSAQLFGWIHRAACGRLFESFWLNVTARDLMF